MVQKDLLLANHKARTTAGGKQPPPPAPEDVRKESARKPSTFVDCVAAGKLSRHSSDVSGVAEASAAHGGMNQSTSISLSVMPPAPCPAARRRCKTLNLARPVNIGSVRAAWPLILLWTSTTST
eukprot:scaffold29905_cov64-Phaeocystis_antarctica.AAC.17